MNMKAIISNETTKRRERMRDAAQKGSFKITAKHVYHLKGKGVLRIWDVLSKHTHSTPRTYAVSMVDDEQGTRWACTCPDFETNGQWFPCKHILYVQEEV